MKKFVESTLNSDHVNDIIISKSPQKNNKKNKIKKYAFLCESVFSSPSMTSLVLEQAFASLPCQQVTSSSTALSTLAEPSQPVITDST